MIEAAMKMIEAERKAQADAGRREYITLARSHRRATLEDCALAYSDTAPRTKPFAAGEAAACAVPRRLKRKPNRAERIARRNAR